MIHLFDIEKEKSVNSRQESINEGLLTLGTVEIIMEQISGVGFKSLYLDQHTNRLKINSDVDSMDSFSLNDTFDKEDLKSLSFQSGSFQKDLPSQVVPNKRIVGLGRTFSITAITADNPGKITCSVSHGLKNGQEVILSKILGMTQLNDQTVVITNVSGQPQSFTIGINTSSYSSYTAGTGIVTPLYLTGLNSQSILNKEIADNPNSYSSWNSRNDSQFFYDTNDEKVINHDEDYVSSIDIEDWSDIATLTNRFSGKFYEFFSTFDSPGNLDNKDFDYTLIKNQDFIDLKERVDNKTGLEEVGTVRVATTENIVLAGLQIIDGVQLLTDDRVLVKDQENMPSTNGIYLAKSGAWQRPSTEDSWEEVIDILVPVRAGTINKNTLWVSDAVSGGTLGTTNLKFIKFSPPELYLWLKNKNIFYYDTEVENPDDIKIKITPNLEPFDVQEVLYSEESVFVKSKGQPKYLESFQPSRNQIFEIPRKPVIEQTKSPVYTPLGVLKNGVPLSTFRDGSSYKNLNFWIYNTVASNSYDENGGINLDGYFHSYLPPKLHTVTAEDEVHSPLLGYALDGHPIYGPYAYTDKDPSSQTTTISKVVSGYKIRSILDRSTLPNGVILNDRLSGPEVPSYDYIVKLATTENLPFTYLNKQGNNASLTSQIIGATIIDGTTVSTGDKILLKNQTNSAINGVYEVIQAGPEIYTTLVRLPIHNTDFIRLQERGVTNASNYGYNAKNGNRVLVTSGKTNKGTSWILDGGQSIGLTPITVTNYEAYPLGQFVEDYEYVGDDDDDTVLDQYNGRFGRTPEYPGGVYAYFMTINEDGTPAFPYIIGKDFYGKPSSGIPGNSIIYGKTNNYINKVEQMNIRVLETNKVYLLKSLSPEEWEINNSFVSYLGSKSKNFFYNKAVGLSSLVTLKLAKDLSFDQSVEKSLKFSGDVQSLTKRTNYETVTGADIEGDYVNIDALRIDTNIHRADPTFDKSTGTWNPVVLDDEFNLVNRFYRTTTPNESYNHDFSNTLISTSRRLDSVGLPTPLSVKIYSTFIIESGLDFNEILSEEGWNESEYAENPESFWEKFV